MLCNFHRSPHTLEFTLHISLFFPPKNCVKIRGRVSLRREEKMGIYYMVISFKKERRGLQEEEATKTKLRKQKFVSLWQQQPDLFS